MLRITGANCNCILEGERMMLYLPIRPVKVSKLRGYWLLTADAASPEGSLQ